jgi:hypothetical protein
MRGTQKQMRGGCFQCHGDKAQWTAKNAVGVAAKHHQATGHDTWVIFEIYSVYCQTFSKSELLIKKVKK